MCDPVASDQAQSLVNAANQMGSFPRWMVANSSTNQMNGDSVAPLLAFTWQFGARDWDVNRAIDIMLENTIGSTAGKFTGGTNTGAGGTNGMTNTRWPIMERPGADYYNEYGYAPQLRPFQADHMVTGASYTLEYAIADFSLATLADAKGRNGTAKQFYERAQWWQNLWNPTADGIQPRDVNGRYPESDPRQQYPASFGYRGNVYDLGQQGFEEGNAEQYLWMVPHNLAGLITAMGGKEAATQRLDTFLSTGLVRGASANVPYMNLDNEPNFGVPWVYNYLGRPDRTSEVVDQITGTLLGYQPAGSEPGNDDLGALANLYVWAALGMYPESSGASAVTFNTPIFDKSVVTLGNGRTLTINAPGAQSGKRYINNVEDQRCNVEQVLVRLEDRGQGHHDRLHRRVHAQRVGHRQLRPPAVAAGRIQARRAQRQHRRLADVRCRRAPARRIGQRPGRRSAHRLEGPGVPRRRHHLESGHRRRVGSHPALRRPGPRPRAAVLHGRSLRGLGLLPGDRDRHLERIVDL
ncbi:glycoside hydrolase domain-containing protein [Dactylosporangium darangshiense]|uniref:glycoside hydrolase domain-containing protein n=1 Tax=Dactylosporangium darangshiense TaxID=579108 RepID=UPI0031E77397